MREALQKSKTWIQIDRYISFTACHLLCALCTSPRCTIHYPSFNPSSPAGDPQSGSARTSHCFGLTVKGKHVIARRAVEVLLQVTDVCCTNIARPPSMPGREEVGWMGCRPLSVPKRSVTSAESACSAYHSLSTSGVRWWPRDLSWLVSSLRREVKATSRTAATRDDDDDNREKDLRRKKEIQTKKERRGMSPYVHFLEFKSLSEHSGRPFYREGRNHNAAWMVSNSTF